MKIICTLPNGVGHPQLNAALDCNQYGCRWWQTVPGGPQIAVVQGPHYQTIRTAIEGLGGTVLPPLHAHTALTSAHVTAFAPFATLTTSDTSYTAGEKLLATLKWSLLDPAQP